MSHEQQGTALDLQAAAHELLGRETLQFSIPSRLRRFFRPTIADPYGGLVHDADCHIFGLDICTCGLIHTITQEDALAEFPQFENDWVRHNQVIDSLTDGKRRQGGD